MRYIISLMLNLSQPFRTRKVAELIKNSVYSRTLAKSKCRCETLSFLFIAYWVQLHCLTGSDPRSEFLLKCVTGCQQSQKRVSPWPTFLTARGTFRRWPAYDPLCTSSSPGSSGEETKQRMLPNCVLKTAFIQEGKSKKPSVCGDWEKARAL